MGSPNFRFKQFTVWHDHCAMKVGTDGVLLGAWCPLPSQAACRVLDIGTGSGLIALMLAQRLGEKVETIDAIDVDSDAVEQASKNFGLSPFAALLHSHKAALQQWKAEQYDVIVSNPPYFNNSLKNPNAQRAQARHTDGLRYEELIAHGARLLAQGGVMALVLPIEAQEEIMALAQAVGLEASHITHVHTKPGKDAKRLLIALRHETQGECMIRQFYIESEQAARSQEYAELTKDFYL